MIRHLLAETPLIPRLPKYVRSKPTPKQAVFLAVPHKEALFGGAAGGGKALTLDTYVKTPYGAKLLGNLKSGDLLANPIGRPQQVLLLHPVERLPVVRLYLDDGSYLDASNEHLWRLIVEDRDKRRSIVTYDTRKLKRLFDDGVYYIPDSTIDSIVLGASGRRIVRLEERGMADVRCITVSASHGLFEASSDVDMPFMVTHNSEALLMAALQYVDVPNYAAIIFRRSYSDLSLAGAMMTRLHEWLRPFRNEVHWNAATKTFTFPSGATVSFGYINSATDHYRYQGSEYQTICFDELTQFTKGQYLYLFSRLRRLKNSDVPLRMRAATNPGGIGHMWVKERFIEENAPDRIFIPSRVVDNPYLDREAYIETLSELDPITREQLLNGDWDISAEGNLFKREWFEITTEPPEYMVVAKVRFWDLAATHVSVRNIDPDYTVGCLCYRTSNGLTYVVDVVRVRETPAGVEEIVRQTAEADGIEVTICMETEPGSSGVAVVDHYSRNVLPDFYFRGVRHTTDKISRAKPVSAQAERGNIKLVQGAWNTAFLAEISLFPNVSHDDQVDALCGAYHELVSSVRQPVVMRQGRLKGRG